MQGLEKQTGVVDIDTAVEEWGWGGGGGVRVGGGVWLRKRDDEISITIIRGQEPIDFPKEGDAERVKSLAKIC